MSDSSSTAASPVESTAAPVEAPALEVSVPKLHKLKVYGEEKELPEEKVLQLAQLGMASNQKFEEASKLRKQAEDVLGGLKSKESFFKSMEAAGLDRKAARALLEDVLRAEYEEEALPPEEVERRKEKAELERLRKERQEQEAKGKAEREAAELAQLTERLEEEMVGAIKDSTLPRNEYFAKVAFNYMASALGQGIEMSAKEAVRLVESDFYESIRQTLSSLDSKSLKSLVGEKGIQTLIKESLAEVKQKEAPFAKPAVAANQEKKPEAKRKQEETSGQQSKIQSHKDFFKNMRGF